MREFEKIFFDPSYLPGRFFCGRARVLPRERNFVFLQVSNVLHQNETTAG
jgi:hypothetical protein